MILNAPHDRKESDPSGPSLPERSAKPQLASFEVGNDRDTAIRLAHRSGRYSLSEIGEHFGLPATAVKRIVSG